MSRLPFELTIPKPCSQQWSEMPGSSTTRHCASCNTQVHNLAALTPRQIERLIVKSNGHFCARVTRLDDGSIITSQERPWPRLEGASFVAAAILAASAPLLAQSKSESPLGISGSLTDQTGAAIAGAQVQLLGTGGTPLRSVTNAEGEFSFNTTAGHYHVQAKALGFVSQEVDIEAIQSRTVLQPITMKVSALMGQVVVVSTNGEEPLAGDPSTKRVRWYRRLLTGTRNLLHL